MKSYEARRQAKWNAVANQITYARHREQEAAELLARRAELLAQGLIDSDCRFARSDLSHECSNRDGRMRPHSSCWMEARRQMDDLAAARRIMEHAIAKAVDDWLQQIASQGCAVIGKPSQSTIDAESRCNPRRLPQYRRAS